MADNVTADTQSGGATFASDDDGSAQHPSLKLMQGADNTFSGYAAAGPGSEANNNPLLITLPTDGTGLTRGHGRLAHSEPDEDESITDTPVYPVKIGGHARQHGIAPTAVTAGDVSSFHCNRHGILWRINGHPLQIGHEFHFTTQQTNTTLIQQAATIAITQVVCISDTSGNDIRIGFAVQPQDDELPPLYEYGNRGMIFSATNMVADQPYTRGNGKAPIALSDVTFQSIIINTSVSANVRLLLSYHFADINGPLVLP